MNPWVVKIAATVALRLAKRQAFRAAARRWGPGKATAGAAALAVAARLAGKRRGRK